MESIESVFDWFN